VYVVDDDREQAKALVYFLIQAGYEALLIESLDEVEVAVPSMRPAAILMDMMFPEGDLAGAEIISRLQEHAETQLPVLFVSARRDFEARLAAARAGSTHYFTKPVDMNRMIDELDKMTRSAGLENGKILLVDDDEETIQLIAAHFENEAFEIECLTDPTTILSVLERFNPDLALIDIHMPECNGLELASVLRQHEVHQDLPIIFLTADTDPHTKLAAMARGCDDIFSKCLELPDLVLAVRSRLKRLKGYAQTQRLLSDHVLYNWLEAEISS
jgi:DNA-binding response OmpR family regulator